MKSAFDAAFKKLLCCSLILVISPAFTKALNEEVSLDAVLLLYTQWIPAVVLSINLSAVSVPSGAVIAFGVIVDATLSQTALSNCSPSARVYTLLSFSFCIFSLENCTALY